MLNEMIELLPIYISIIIAVIAVIALIISIMGVNRHTNEYTKNLITSSIIHLHTIHEKYGIVDGQYMKIMDVIISNAEIGEEKEGFPNGTLYYILADFEGIASLWKNNIIAEEQIRSHFGLYLESMNMNPKVVQMANKKIRAGYVFPNLRKLLKEYSEPNKEDL